MINNDKVINGKIETLKHIDEVRKNLYSVVDELLDRALKHDLSKLESPEVELFGEFTPELAKTEYNSKEYLELLAKVKPAIGHHYSKNRHHPQFWVNGINDMTLIDLLEMICDWRAATKRNKNGNIRTSIDHNATRFNIDFQLTKIFHNTVRELFKD